jgi:hypothetical protein
VSVTLVHYFHTEVSTVDDVCPSVDYTTLGVNYRLVEVETVKVECHGGNTKSSEPDTNYRPSCKEEVKGTGVVERRVLEDQTTKVTVCCNNVVSLFFLTELVTCVCRFVLGSLTDEGRGYEGTVHSGEKGTTEYTSNTKHVEWVHEDVVLSLENDHEVESTRNSQRHSVGERTLTEWVDDEYSGSCCNRCRVSYSDPRTHTETEGEFPLTTHPATYTNEEVTNNHEVRTSVVKPLIDRCSFPDRVEVKTDCVGHRNNCTGNDVVTVKKGTRNRLTDTINIYRRSCDECDDEYGSSSKKTRDHKNTEPADVKTVLSRGDPLAELGPDARVYALFEDCSHGFNYY